MRRRDFLKALGCATAMLFIPSWMTAEAPSSYVAVDPAFYIGSRIVNKRTGEVMRITAVHGNTMTVTRRSFGSFNHDPMEIVNG